MTFESSIILIQLLILFFSTVIHEVAHGYVAKYLGDDTAEKMGRLTLNPIKHIDLFGSIILPLMLVLTKSPFIFGWAKPVPLNPFNLRNPKTQSGIIAAVGPLSNIVLALAFGLTVRVLAPIGVSPMLLLFLSLAAFLNFAWAVFNLIPIPPLDGSRILFALLPDKYCGVQRAFEVYGIIIIFLFLFIAYGFIFGAAGWLFNFVVGNPIDFFFVPFSG